SSSNTVAGKLKDSLAEALELYLPVAGAIHSYDDGSTGLYIATDSENRQGTPFLLETKNIPYTENDDEKNMFSRGTSLLPAGSSISAVKVTQ
ncbi:hypothetical protein BDB00DRAFT_727383, partial [Zychaea mexicana]|uniref:uncharacterized protein n=1 Tax=Zychaea mexicana TaxID=64656 RepID=UPI0022FE34C5